jgi:hypothetical protein
MQHLKFQSRYLMEGYFMHVVSAALWAGAPIACLAFASATVAQTSLPMTITVDTEVASWSFPHF